MTAYGRVWLEMGSANASFGDLEIRVYADWGMGAFLIGTSKTRSPGLVCQWKEKSKAIQVKVNQLQSPVLFKSS